MKISINAVTEGFKTEPKITIYLSPMKAKILGEQLVAFEKYLESTKNVDPNVAFGVNAGMKEKVTFIAFHANEAKTVIITIGTFDANGTVLDRYDYTLNTDYNFGLTWKNLDTNELDKTYFNSVEFDQIKDVINDFARYMNGALAYSVADLTRYDTNKINARFNSIFDKLGIERTGSNGGYNRSSFNGNSFLNNSSSSHKTLDEVEEDFMD
jgi:hypothetical protein